jgi:hypothetical protein
MAIANYLKRQERQKNQPKYATNKVKKNEEIALQETS